MSFTAYTITRVAPPHPHREIMEDPDILSVEWDNEAHTGVKLIHASGYWHYSSPYPIKVTRWAALIPFI